MNFRLNVFPATVKNNLDPLQEDRVQIMIPHLFGQVPIPSLPWALPWDSSLAGGSPTSGSSHVPENNSQVWVAIENMKLLDPIYYLASFRFKLNAASSKLFYTLIKPQLTGSSAVYPDMKFTRLKNGMAWGVSSGNLSKEAFIFHPSGTQVFINNLGKIRIKVGTNSLATVLDTLLTQIQALTVQSPVGPTSTPLNAAAFATIQTQLAAMLLI